MSVIFSSLFPDDLPAAEAIPPDFAPGHVSGWQRGTLSAKMHFALKLEPKLSFVSNRAEVVEW